jgi:predicted ATPase/class 3 adenylate cyclase
MVIISQLFLPDSMQREEISRRVKSMHTSLPTGTVTFLYTDIEDSTGLAQNHPVEMPLLLSQHHAILRHSIQSNHGHVFRIMGDAFCAAFFTASDALQAALEAQRQLQQAAWHPAEIKVRMGIHTGPAQAGGIEEVAGGYTGYLTLTRAQRVMSTAHGGQILITSATSELLRETLPEGVELRDMGEHRLKGLLNPERIWQVTAPDLLSEFPALKSPYAIPNNLPAQINRFIGREHELSQTRELLSNARLLTLIGPGGTGKTRLTLQLAGEVLPEFADGVWLVELAPLSDPALVLQTIAGVLGLREIPGESLKDLVTDHLCSKHLALILDNCEHLVETCAVLADHFLRSCPNLKIIASSREALGIAGETVYLVPPMALPDSDGLSAESLSRSEAVQLFVERAAAVKAGFGLSEHNAPAVVRICRQLDGIPLALELAAARIGMLSPKQIAARLDDRFRLLTAGSRTALPRQQTLRSLIDWSYDLLSAMERLLFCRLSVFVGSWSLEAVEAVCPELDVLPLMAGLVHKSLVVADESMEEAATRFRMLETIRQYAHEKLEEHGETQEISSRHASFFAQLAEEAEAYLRGGSETINWLQRLESEHGNLRAALDWCLSGGDQSLGAQMAGSLTFFWFRQDHHSEGRIYLEQALKASERAPKLIKAKLFVSIGTLAYTRQDLEACFEAYQKGAGLYREVDDPAGLGTALAFYGGILGMLQPSRYSEAVSLCHEALGILRKIDDKPRIVQALNFTGEMFRTRGDYTKAKVVYEECLSLAMELGDLLRQSMMFQNLGFIAIRKGDYQRAKELCSQGIRLALKIKSTSQLAATIMVLAGVYTYLLPPEKGARLMGAGEAMLESSGVVLQPADKIEIVQYQSGLKELLGEMFYEEAFLEGRQMSLEEVIATALE